MFSGSGPWPEVGTFRDLAGDRGREGCTPDVGVVGFARGVEASEGEFGRGISEAFGVDEVVIAVCSRDETGVVGVFGEGIVRSAVTAVGSRKIGRGRGRCGWDGPASLSSSASFGSNGEMFLEGSTLKELGEASRFRAKADCGGGRVRRGYSWLLSERLRTRLENGLKRGVVLSGFHRFVWP